LLSLNRTGLYYQPVPHSAQEVGCKHRIDEIYTTHPYYGYRRIAAQLHRDGQLINPKTVARRLAQMGVELAQVETIVAAIGEALDGQCLTREELGEAVARRVGSWATEAVSPAFGGHWPR
jgi:hypothetical protein